MQRMSKFILSALTAAALHTTAAAPAHAESRIILDPQLQDAIRSQATRDLSKHIQPNFIVPRADLVVQAAYAGNGPEPQSGFCDVMGNTSVIHFRIRNIGDVTSANSVIKVNWGQYGTKTYSIAGISPGSFKTYKFNLPNAVPETWYAGFTITADATNTVMEKSEANNAQSGQCFKIMPDNTGSGRS